MVKDVVPTETNIFDFVIKIDVLDARLKGRLVSRFDMFREKIERLVSDDRLLEVRQQF
jgi:pantothenate kinase